MIMYCYEIKNLVNGKRYFGITQYPKRRFKEHKNGWGSKILVRAFKKYGIENFSFTVFAASDAEYIKNLEIRAIKHFNTFGVGGYNLTVGGATGMLGHKHSQDTRKKMRKATFGQVYTEETRNKVSLKHQRGGNPRARKVLVGGHEYACIKDAAEVFGFNYNGLRAQFSQWKKSNTFPEGYSYIDE